MRPIVIALDVDGTLYDGDGDGGSGVHPEATAALTRAVGLGHHVVIVTGRRWASLGDVVPGVLALAEAAVCEDGRVLADPSTGAVEVLAPLVDPALVDALEAAGVAPLDVGLVVIGTPTRLHHVVENVLRRGGWTTLELVENKDSVAIAPPGADKGTGLRRAIAAHGLGGLDVVAVGDAANDLPMFAVADHPRAVANADHHVRAAGVPLLTCRAGRGVAEALRPWLARC